MLVAAGTKIILKEALVRLKALASKNDQAVLDAYWEMFQEIVFDLQARVEQIENSDLDLQERAKVLRDFFDAAKDAIGEEQREALMAAAAAQFDPAAGRKAVRNYWWRFIGELSPIEIAVVSMIGDGRLVLDYGTPRLYWTSDAGPANVVAQSDELGSLRDRRAIEGYTADDVNTIREVASHLMTESHDGVWGAGGSMVTRGNQVYDASNRGRPLNAFRLTPFGLRLHRFLTLHPPQSDYGSQRDGTE